MAPVLKVLTIGLNGLVLANRIIKYTIHYVLDSDFEKIKLPKWNFDNDKLGFTKSSLLDNTPNYLVGCVIQKRKGLFSARVQQEKKLASHFKSKVFFYQQYRAEKVIYTLK